MSELHYTNIYTIVFFFPSSAPSLIGMVRKDWASQSSIALSWQEPDYPNGVILDYEIKYYEKVGLAQHSWKNA